MQVLKEIKLPTDAQILRHWLNYSTSRGDYNTVKKQLVCCCFGENYSERDFFTFRNWLYGRSKIPTPAKILMNAKARDLGLPEIFNLA